MQERTSQLKDIDGELQPAEGKRFYFSRVLTQGCIILDKDSLFTRTSVFILRMFTGSADCFVSGTITTSAQRVCIFIKLYRVIMKRETDSIINPY